MSAFHCSVCGGCVDKYCPPCKCVVERPTHRHNERAPQGEQPEAREAELREVCASLADALSGAMPLALSTKALMLEAARIIRFGYVPAPRAEPVEPLVMGLCETRHLLLKPQTYRFVVMPGCAKCEAAAREATDMPWTVEGSTLAPLGVSQPEEGK